MALRADERAPYRAALGLFGWVTERRNWNDLDGHLLYGTGRGLDAMHLRELLNVAYARLKDGRDSDELKELDETLELPEPVEKKRRTKRSGGMAALLASTRMPQAGAAVGPRRPAEGASTP